MKAPLDMGVGRHRSMRNARPKPLEVFRLSACKCMHKCHKFDRSSADFVTLSLRL